MDLCASAQLHRRLPFSVRKRAGDFYPAAKTIQITTMHASKGLEFPVVALPGVGHMPVAGVGHMPVAGVGHMPVAGEDEADAARVFYVAATRATQWLVIGVGGDDGFGTSFACHQNLAATTNYG